MVPSGTLESFKSAAICKERHVYLYTYRFICIYIQIIDLYMLYKLYIYLEMWVFIHTPPPHKYDVHT